MPELLPYQYVVMRCVPRVEREEFVNVGAGDERGGSAAAQSLGQRFGFLKAPRSTVLQPGPVHGGLAADPRAELERLLDAAARARAASGRPAPEPLGL